MSLVNRLSCLKFRRDTWGRDIHLGANGIQMVSETMGVSEQNNRIRVTNVDKQKKSSSYKKIKNERQRYKKILCTRTLYSLAYLNYSLAHSLLFRFSENDGNKYKHRSLKQEKIDSTFHCRCRATQIQKTITYK